MTRAHASGGLARLRDAGLVTAKCYRGIYEFAAAMTRKTGREGSADITSWPRPSSAAALLNESRERRAPSAPRVGELTANAVHAEAPFIEHCRRHLLPHADARSGRHCKDVMLPTASAEARLSASSDFADDFAGRQATAPSTISMTRRAEPRGRARRRARFATYSA